MAVRQGHILGWRFSPFSKIRNAGHSDVWSGWFAQARPFA
jgi:hypothetical protein